MLSIYIDDTNIQFDSPEQIVKFLTSESSFWENKLSSGSQVRSEFQSRLKNLTSSTNRYLEAYQNMESESSLDDSTKESNLKDICKNIKSNLEAPYKEKELISQYNVHIDVIEQLEPETCSGYVVAISNVSSNYNAQKKSEVQGFVLGTINELTGIGILPNYKTHLDSLTHSFKELFEDIDKRIDEFDTNKEVAIDQLRQLTEESKKRFDSELSEQISRLNSHKTEFKKVFDAELRGAKTEINETKKSFGEDVETLKNYVTNEIATESSVTYWQQKSKRHTRLSIFWGIASVILAIIAIFGISFASLNILSGEELSFSDLSISITPLSKISIIAFLITIAIWTLKITTRYMNLNTQLAEDSTERVVLVKTFLSLLRKDGALTNEDQSLIMQALFRPSQVSLISNNDGSPDHFWDFMSHYRKAQSRSE